ncbi:transposable element Tcb2 transposase [Trichonephila clavipes]|nr:transposable element Tcb2 transposase [Trichonephila clavipes]
MGFCAVHRRVRFTMESDSGRLLIWRKQRTRYHQSNTVERHSYRGGGILVCAGISLGGHTDLHVFHGGTVTGLRYRDEILDPYVRPYAAAIGNDFILMDDNARPHRARIVEEYLEDHGLERMEWPARSPDLNPIEHFWDYIGREVAALNSPPRSLHELKQGLLCVWSSLPIPVGILYHYSWRYWESSWRVAGGGYRFRIECSEIDHNVSITLRLGDYAGQNRCLHPSVHQIMNEKAPLHVILPFRVTINPAENKDKATHNMTDPPPLLTAGR